MTTTETTLREELAKIRNSGYSAFMDGDKIAVKFDGDKYGKFERVSTHDDVAAIKIERELDEELDDTWKDPKTLVAIFSKESKQ